ncbi:Bcr/CflA family drug resistance efflux transporter [Sphingobium jiangsuense]|uniref:Bcr/CflA family efflux transporter n=1 Tax=Sphingobium jiangsuense TaxID=870476 RepID=A0A7W6BRC6_9SPHN|nr:multidrug effflux MFS transporter [Sphingobium jiangsuense]MBB3927368.1 DHA1 family bicyclomycin/chloramphenicol resistance-like MFS transporter [Sphingobium jiangsuense]GLT00770.1 Bcr/CflA family drug resistance efflux transporter [Sphingobium jiangsuense]
MLTRKEIILLATFGAIAPLAIDMYLPAMPALAANLGISARLAGQSVSVFLIGIAAGQLVTGPLSDRLGRRPMILSGLALFTLASLVAAMATAFPVLLAARLFQALGACAVMVSGRAVVRDRLDARESARLFSLLALIGGMAPVLAPMIGAGIIQFGEWRLIFLVMAAFSLLTLLFAFPVLTESRSAATAANARFEHPFRSYVALLRNRQLLGYLATAACNSAAFFTYVANSATVLIDGYGMTPRAFSILFAANSVGLVCANQINRRLLRTRMPAQVLRLSARNALVFASALLLFAATGAGGLPVLVGLLFLVVASIAPVQANTMAGGLGVDPLRSGSTAALFGATTFTAGAIASWIAGLAYRGDGGGLAVVVAFCLVGSALATFRLVAREPDPQPAE